MKSLCGIFFLVAVASMAALALEATANATPTIDQEQPVIDTSAGWGLGIGGSSEQKLAQVVTPGVTGLLTEARLSAACTDTLTVEVQGVSGGVPDGTFVGGVTVPFSGTFPTTFRSIAFTTPVRVTAGRPYALVLTTTGSCGIWPGPVGNPYPGGDAFFDSRPNAPGVWVPLSSGRADLYDTARSELRIDLQSGGDNSAEPGCRFLRTDSRRRCRGRVDRCRGQRR